MFAILDTCEGDLAFMELPTLKGVSPEELATNYADHFGFVVIDVIKSEPTNAQLDAYRDLWFGVIAEFVDAA